MGFHGHGRILAFIVQTVGAPCGEVANLSNPVRVGFGFTLPDFLQETIHDRLGVTFDPYRYGVVSPDFLRVDLDLDNLGVCWDESVVVESGGLAKSSTHGQYGVGLTHRLNSF